jgi:hypothetical protein
VWFAATKGLDGLTEIDADPVPCASAVLSQGPYESPTRRATPPGDAASTWKALINV